MFCAACGKILQLKHTPYGKWMACSEGHSQPKLVQTAEILTSKNSKPSQEIKVSDGKNMLAVHDHACKKCGYGKAELIEIAPFYSDEDTIIKMKCGRCKAVEIEEGKFT
jgi:predicted Zn-ribbon and HTH transcriptional regulator